MKDWTEALIYHFCLTIGAQFFLWLCILSESVEIEPQVIPVSDHLPIRVQDAGLEVNDRLNTQCILVLDGNIVSRLLAEGVGLDIKRWKVGVRLRCSVQEWTTMC